MHDRGPRIHSGLFLFPVSTIFLVTCCFLRVDQNDDLKYLEGGILMSEFFEVRNKRKIDMEFRVLQRMT
jgi:hypothetical protein